MKFKLGEFVRFVEERREGYITRIIDENTIAVTDDDGFEIPVLASQVTRIHGQPWQDNEDTGPSAIIPAAEFIRSGIYLAVVPDRRTASVAHFQLVNTTSYSLLASLVTANNGKFRGEFKGIVPPESAIKVYAASLNELDQWPAFNMQILLHTTEDSELNKPLEFKQKFRGKDFSTSKEKHSLLEDQAWLFRVDPAEDAVDIEKLREKFNQ